LELASDQVGAYGESHLEVLSILANQAAVAIQDARLYAKPAPLEQTSDYLLTGRGDKSGRASI